MIIYTLKNHPYMTIYRESAAAPGDLANGQALAEQARERPRGRVEQQLGPPRRLDRRLRSLRGRARPRLRSLAT